MSASFNPGCRANSYGPLCGLCMPGFVPVDTVCEQCDDTGPFIVFQPGGIVLLTLACLVGSVLVALVVFQLADGVDLSLSVSELKRMFVAAHGVVAPPCRRVCSCCFTAPQAPKRVLPSYTYNPSKYLEESSGQGASSTVSQLANLKHAKFLDGELWRTKLKIAITFYQVRLLAKEAAFQPLLLLL